MKPILASLLLVGLAACKGRNKPPSAGAGSAPAPVADATVDAAAEGSGLASADLDPADFEGPTEKVVKEVFGGKAPALPMLSSDGAIAAVDLSEVLGLSDMSTYMVGFQDGKQQVDRVVLLDVKAAMVEDLKVTDPLKSAAAALSKRLADGGFTPFEKHVERQPEDEKAVDLGVMGKLSFKHATDSGPDVGSTPLELAVFDGTGKPVAKEIIQARPGGKRTGDCGGEPRLGDVWYDLPRKRALARIYYVTGGDVCSSIPGFYRMWTLP